MPFSHGRLTRRLDLQFLPKLILPLWPLNSSPETTVPRVLKFSGILKDSMGQPRTGVRVMFSLYEDEEGGAPLFSFFLDHFHPDLGQRGGSPRESNGSFLTHKRCRISVEFDCYEPQARELESLRARRRRSQWFSAVAQVAQLKTAFGITFARRRPTMRRFNFRIPKHRTRGSGVDQNLRD
jgi:hypothetical protein